VLPFVAPDNVTIASSAASAATAATNAASAATAAGTAATDAAAIKTQTDKLQFDGSNNVLANAEALPDPAPDGYGGSGGGGSGSNFEITEQDVSIS
jgi:opacity protein-like surface antigen